MDKLTTSHYVPVLKVKQGDLWALRHLTARSQAYIRPLLEMVPPTANKPIQSYLDKKISDIHRNLGSRHYFIDFEFLDSEDYLSNDMHPLRYFWDSATAGAQFPVPVTGLTRTPPYQRATQSIVARSQEAMIRLVTDDFDDERGIGTAIDAMVRFLGIEPHDIHLALDLKALGTMNTSTLRRSVAGLLSEVPNLEDWKSVVLIAGSFPQSLTQTVSQREAWVFLPRREWMLWGSLRRQSGGLSRLPTYADYAIGDPGLPYSGFATYTVTLRYSHNDQFMVWCGLPAQEYDDGNEQIYAVCEELVLRREFAGGDFSEGDRQILARAATEDSPGNAGSWRQWGTSHYLELAVSQLANLDVP